MKVASIELFRIRLPFRVRFEHRAAVRKESAGLVTRIVLDDGTVGWGEGVPREYVTGENVESSAQAVREFYVPLVRPLSPADFSQAVTGAASLPTLPQKGRVFNAARCSVELALFDAYGRCFRKKLSEAAAFLPGPDTPGPIPAADQGVSSVGTRAGVQTSGERYRPAATAVLPAGGPLKVRWLYRAFRTAGFRDFKLKVGFPDDERRFGFILAKAGRKDQKRITVRADANGAWTLQEAEKNMTTLMRTGVHHFEQPLAKDDWDGYRRLAAGIGPQAVILDESLRTIEDAHRAARERLSQGFNIRISKNGGFCPSLEIARLAGAHGIDIYLGAMVGETGILAAAQRHLLAAAPRVTAVEPAFNRFLLKRDIVHMSRPGRWSIKPRSLDSDCPGFGLGIEIDEKVLVRFGESIFRASF
jgi:L-Ala-D/L-Glu epimerase